MTKLTLKQKLFCQHYIETIGNGTESVIKAGYSVKQQTGNPDRILAKSIASENLTKPYIKEYIDQLLQLNGFNDQSIKLQHLNLISQNENLMIKAKSIDMYYKLSGRYAATKVEQSNPGLEAAMDRLASILP